MRSKEEAYDYRYFPEPDLVPLAPGPEWLAAVRCALPPMPAERRLRVAGASGLAADSDPVATVVRLDLDTFVMAAVDVGADAGLAVRRLANEVASEVDRSRHLDPDGFCRLLLMESKGELTSTQARDVLKHMLDARRRSGRHRRPAGVRSHGRRRPGWRGRPGDLGPPGRSGLASPPARTSWPASSLARSRPPPRARPTSRRWRRCCASAGPPKAAAGPAGRGRGSRGRRRRGGRKAGITQPAPDPLCVGWAAYGE